MDIMRWETVQRKLALRGESMTNRELRKLSRAELLELLLTESRENERLRAQLEDLEAQLADRSIQVEFAGSLAEAALRLNGVFRAADQAAAQYLENVRRMAGERIHEKEAISEHALHEAAGG